MLDKSIDELAQILWDYNFLKQPLKKSEAILVLGSNDIRVAEHAAKLFLEGFAPLLIFSGNQGVTIKDKWDEPEAEVFAKRAIELGVSEDKIIKENKSTNTGENILFTKQLLEDKGLKINSFILVQKPYMLRRTFATFKKQWPGKDFIVSAPEIDFKDYPNQDLPKDLVINILVGDTQRIKEYPKRGFQIPQDIPEKVWQAFEELVRRGYNKHLI